MEYSLHLTLSCWHRVGQGRIKGGGRGPGGQDPPPFGGPQNFIKKEKMVGACARKLYILVLNSYPDPPFSEILYPPLLVMYGGIQVYLTNTRDDFTPGAISQTVGVVTAHAIRKYVAICTSNCHCCPCEWCWRDWTGNRILHCCHWAHFCWKMIILLYKVDTLMKGKSIVFYL